jgi:hypothetical protein
VERETLLRGCGCAVLAVAGAVGGVGFLTCAGLWGAGSVMNNGPISVAEINPDWKVSVRSGGQAGGQAAMALSKAIEGQCKPMSNGVRVLFNHAWYNAITDGYDAQIWIENKAQYDSYALYVWGNHAFLRDEVGAGGYVNRVLTCDLDAAGWLALVAGTP